MNALLSFRTKVGPLNVTMFMEPDKKKKKTAADSSGRLGFLPYLPIKETKKLENNNGGTMWDGVGAET